MKIIQIPVGRLQANCYLVINEKTNHCVIVDPGDDAEFIIETITTHSSPRTPLKPLALLATHGHFDHVMAATPLQLAYNLPCYLHPKDQFLLDRQEETIKHFLGGKVAPPPPQTVTNYAQSKNQKLKPLTIGPFTFKVLHVPGHTPGSVGLYLTSDNCLFCGDVLFPEGGWGRTDFSYSSHSDLQASIQSILKLPDATLLYCGHGTSPESSTVKKEKQYWPKLSS